eukprot:CAMPEP_0201519040 /NCGR_PEP_ID=MMETSP0161_2-20130828/9699_1 /ASSEMBLY_ACC=CAM_ASM_000251 /TAXON_ID=180227 /ORGANISM="Neoparamoeba aestuarina, Strain SoJaBio B1-5/56/2" /LENGTH=209 /DNA_ID=CAMNT_0047916961 /DNA_START=42 /DNA_END=668 /DNA_ORIENTATION=-
MKYKFCGDLDVPDWILREIATLAKLSSIRAKIIAGNVIKHLLGESADYEKIKKLTSDSGLETADVKASLAALLFIISSSAKYDVSDEVMAKELLSLGLPNEHCEALKKPYKENKDKLRDAFMERSLRFDSLKDVQWRVEYIMSSSLLADVGQPSCSLLIKKESIVECQGGERKREEKDVCFEVSDEKLRVLLHELETAQGLRTLNFSSD